MGMSTTTATATAPMATQATAQVTVTSMVTSMVTQARRMEQKKITTITIFVEQHLVQFTELLALMTQAMSTVLMTQTSQHLSGYRPSTRLGIHCCVTIPA